MPDDVKISPRRLLDAVVSHSVTIIMGTPSLVSRFGQAALFNTLLAQGSACRALVLGGETFPPAPTIQSWWPADSQTVRSDAAGVSAKLLVSTPTIRCRLDVEAGASAALVQAISIC